MSLSSVPTELLFKRVRSAGLFDRVVLDTSVLAPSEVLDVLSVANLTIPVALWVPLGRLVTLTGIPNVPVFYAASGFWVPSTSAFSHQLTNPIAKLHNDATALTRFLFEPFPDDVLLGSPIPARDIPLLKESRVTVVFGMRAKGSDCVIPDPTFGCSDSSGVSEFGLLSLKEFVTFVEQTGFPRIALDSFEKLPISWRL
jgi:hypothetical protein